jgi:hypothetical protein
MKTKQGRARERAKVHPKRPAKPAPKRRNWAEYEASQARRYDLEVWFDEAVLNGWYNAKKSYGVRRRAYKYSTPAILAVLGCGALFRYPLRGAEHFTNSLLRLVGRADLRAPDHSTLCRARKRLRIPLAPALPSGPLVLLIDGTGVKVYGAGEWLRAKHDVTERSRWRRLTLCVDYATGQVVSHTLMPSEGVGTGETSQVAPLLEAAASGGVAVAEVIADRLFDARHVYETVGNHGGLPVIIPQQDAAYGLHPARDNHLKTAGRHGVAELKARLDYGRRSLVETAMSRVKGLTGDRLGGRSLEAQRGEMAVRLMALNRVTIPAAQLRNG